MRNIIYGKNTCKNALIKNNTLKKIFLINNFKDNFILELIHKKHFSIDYISHKEMDKLTSNSNHQGIAIEVNDYTYLELDELLELLKDEQYPTIAILDGIEDPHNFGAIIRSGDAFGISGYIIASNRQVGLNNTVAHVSTGAIEYAKVSKVTNINQAIRKLKDNGYWIISSDGHASMSYKEIDFKMKSAIVIGSEGKGISQLVLKNSDFVTKINMIGHVNSLNASVAAALYFEQSLESKYDK